MTTHDNSARRPRSRSHAHTATATTHPAQLAPSAQPVLLAQPPLFTDAQPPAAEADTPTSAHEAPRPGRSPRGSRRAARSSASAAANANADVALVAPPGQPIAPVAGLAAPGGGPRQWEYPVGYNIAGLPRARELTSFAELRSLATLFDGIQLCIRALRTSDSRDPLIPF